MSVSNIVKTLPLVLNNRPVYYLIHITSRCNARCAHCFYWQEIEAGRTEKDVGFEEFERISKHMGRVLVVNLCGAEPYMRGDLCEIAHLFAANNHCRLITIPSNGLLTERIVAYTARICEENPETFFRFAFSLDGPRQIHDKIRDVPGLFDKVCETIHQVAKLHDRFSNFSLLVTTIFSTQTQGHILGFLDWIEENLPVDQSNVTFVRGKPLDRKTLDADPLIYNKVIARLRRHPVKSKINKQTDALLSYSMFLNTLRTVICAQRNPQRRAFRCYAGSKFLVISRQLEVYPCELLDETRSLGNLRDFDYDINALLASSSAKDIVHWVKQKQCACTWECAIQASKVFDLLQWPALGWRALNMKLFHLSRMDKTQ